MYDDPLKRLSEKSVSIDRSVTHLEVMIEELSYQHKLSQQKMLHLQAQLSNAIFGIFLLIAIVLGLPILRLILSFLG